MRHKLLGIVVIVLFAKLADADDWEEIEMFAECHTVYQSTTIRTDVPSIFVHNLFTHAFVLASRNRERSA